MVDIICMSHSVNVAGSHFLDTCKITNKVADAWSSMVKESAIVRRLFSNYTGEYAKSKSSVRWYSWYEVCAQIRKHLSYVMMILNDAAVGRDTTRVRLLHYVTTNMQELRLELALLDDYCLPMVRVCYELEGDSFHSPLAFDKWESLRNKGTSLMHNQNRISPEVILECISTEPNNAVVRQQLFQETTDKAVRPFAKVEEDSRIGERLYSQLQVFQACRLLNYAFVAQQPLNALENEVTIRLHVIPSAALMIPFVMLELELYKTIASAAYHAIPADANGIRNQPSPEELWLFWKANCLLLPKWYAIAEIGALVMTSSASVERVFSLYSNCFDAQQDNTLEDKIESSIMLNYNNNKRKNDRP